MALGTITSRNATKKTSDGAQHKASKKQAKHQTRHFRTQWREIQTKRQVQLQGTTLVDTGLVGINIFKQRHRTGTPTQTTRHEINHPNEDIDTIKNEYYDSPV